MSSIYAELLERVQAETPLVHHITNYVTVNDCANITLAIGASPIMADAIEEAGEIAAMASSLVLNIGTLNSRTIESMLVAGKAANEKGVPVVFGPVGAGASNLRNGAIKRIMDDVKVSVICGNISEIRYVSGLDATTRGVDAHENDATGDPGLIACELAKKLGCVVAITGAADSVSNGQRTIRIENGHSALSKITGTGCMCSSLLGSFCGAAPDKPLDAAVAALLCMGVAGEIAFEKAGLLGGGSYRTAILDAVSKLDAGTLERRAMYHEARN